jgi:hypothetical protein
MKTILITALLIFSNNCFSQSSEKSIHPKVAEYKVLVNQYLETGTQGDKEKQKQIMVPMGKCSQEIICLLSKEQCIEVMPYFVENNLRERSCGAPQFPNKAILNKLSFDEYKSCIKRMSGK